MTVAPWFIIAAALVVLLLLAVIVAFVFAVRRARSGGDATPVVSLTLTLSTIVAGLSVLRGALTTIAASVGSQVDLPVRAADFWPFDAPGLTVSGQRADVVTGGFGTAQVGVEGLSTPVRVLWSTHVALDGLLPAIIATLVAVVCFQLLRGAAFAPVVSRAALVTAGAVLVAGLGFEITGAVAGALASQEVFTYSGVEALGYPDGWNPLDMLPRADGSWEIQLWPIGAALGFAALAAVFRYGSRLQRDTEGLV